MNGAAAYGSYGSYEGTCHIGPMEVMTIGEAKIWSGKWSEMNNDLDFDLRIRLNDGFSLRLAPLVNADRQASLMLGPEVTRLKYPPTLNIDWDDFGAPSLDRKWWLDLIVAIKRLGPVNIAVYCHGGHGRTGTALSILAALSKQDRDGTKDIVQWVRNVYCHEAVESYAQIDYIEAITGQGIVSQPTSVLKRRHKGNQGYTTTWEQPGIVTPVPSTITPETTQLNPKNTVQSSTARDVMIALNKKGAKR